MSEYWKSNPKYYCKYCKAWFADNKVQRLQHESGEKHKLKVEEILKNMYKDNVRRREEEFKLGEDLRRINEAAERAYYHDLHPGQKGSSTMEPTYGTYDAYGGWYDGHGNYYTFKDEKWEYVGFFPNKDYIPNKNYISNNNDDTKKTDGGGNAEKSDEEEKKVVGAGEVGEWTIVKEDHREKKRHKIVIAVKDRREKRPGAEDSEDEDEAEAATRTEGEQRGEREGGSNEKETVEVEEARAIVFKKKTHAKKQRKIRQREEM